METNFSGHFGSGTMEAREFRLMSQYNSSKDKYKYALPFGGRKGKKKFTKDHSERKRT